MEETKDVSRQREKLKMKKTESEDLEGGRRVGIRNSVKRGGTIHL